MTEKKLSTSVVRPHKLLWLLMAVSLAALIVVYAIRSTELVLPIAAATLVSEDLTCIGAGFAAAQGRISLGLAVFACFLGIFVGDILLFLAGRYLGRPAIQRMPLKWFVRAEDVERASAWFTRRGGGVILISRFVPGMRLPTYFAAGLLNTNFLWFALYFSFAAAIWTPLLVGLSRGLGAEVLKSALIAEQSLFTKALIAGAAAYIITKFIMKLSTWRGRRMLVSS